jgi:hypothetical protein
MYKLSLQKKGQKSTRFEKVTTIFVWHIKFWSDLWNCREEISEYYRSQFQTHKGLNFIDTSEARLARRTNSESGFPRYVD